MSRDVDENGHLIDYYQDHENEYSGSNPKEESSDEEPPYDPPDLHDDNFEGEGEDKEINVKMNFVKENIAPSCVMIDLSDSGPVNLIMTGKGKGLLIHHAFGGDPDKHVTVVSLTTGDGFTLTKDAASKLAFYLLKWSGVSHEWNDEIRSWFLAK